MTELDEIVRASLEAQVTRPPLMQAPGDRAIARARSYRRRRRAAAICVGVVVVALSIGGYAALRNPVAVGPPVPPATQPVPSATPAVSAGPGHRPDLLVDRSDTGFGYSALLTADGRTIPLTEVEGAVFQAYQISGGWLLVASVQGVGNALWLLGSDGTAQRLLDRAGEIIAAPGGHRVAWSAAGRLHVGHLTGPALVEDGSSPAPPRGLPIAYTGTAVILGYSETGGGIDHHDVWIPAQGAYVASWEKTTGVVAVYQPAADGSLFGVVQAAVGSKSVCLAKLDPTNYLHATRTACGLPLRIDPTALVSPDGKWLAAPALDNGVTKVVLLDLGRVFDTPAVAQTWAATGPVAWFDATALIVRSFDALMVATVGQPNLADLTGTGRPATATVEPVQSLR